MIAATLPRVSPGVADVLAEAMASLSHCTDLVASAGCAPAAAYVAGAEGCIRRALAELVNRSPHLALKPDEFETRRVGSSEVLSVGGFADTIRGCLSGDGVPLAVRALVQTTSVEGSCWLRPTGELDDVHVRGRVGRSSEGYSFVDEPDFEQAAPRPRADLGRDLLLSGLDVSRRPVFAAALEVTLTSGAWVHLATNTRWFADHATARAVVRLAGGAPGVDVRLRSRLGACVDREALCHIETLGWRHWPTPPMEAKHEN